MKVKTLMIFLTLPIVIQAAAVFRTPKGAAVTDGSVDATATFTLLSPTQLQIILSDNLANPISVGHLISDLQFFITGIGGLSLSSMSNTGITINGDHTSTPGGAITSGWVEGPFAGGFLLCVICAPGFPSTANPSELIIGPGPYTNANGSIAGNLSNNPFLNHSATFVFDVTGITQQAALGKVVFSFGTQFGSDVTGVLIGGTPVLLEGGDVPEPGSAATAAVAFGIVVCALRRRSRRV